MYENEKKKLLSVLGWSLAARYKFIRESLANINQACTNIFNENSQMLTVDIFEALSVWTMECDEPHNCYELDFLSSYFNQLNINFSEEEWFKQTVSEARQKVVQLITKAKHTVILEPKKYNNFPTLYESIVTLFLVLATCDGHITDEVCEEFVKITKLNF